MSLKFTPLYRVLCLAFAAQSAAAYSAPVRPSDCKPRDADSTCAAAVAMAPAPPLIVPDALLTDIPLGGVPNSGYAYWGYDFASELRGVPSPFLDDLFVNRSPHIVTVTLSFTVPNSPSCRKDCLPGVQFEVDAGWIDVAPPLIVKANTASASYNVRPGQAYGWVIGLWRATNPRLSVKVPAGAHTTLAEVGLPIEPSVAQEIPAVVTTCQCSDGTSQACSLGNRFSNGLMGPWYRSSGFYARAGAFNDCPIDK